MMTVFPVRLRVGRTPRTFRIGDERVRGVRAAAIISHGVEFLVLSIASDRPSALAGIAGLTALFCANLGEVG